MDAKSGSGSSGNFIWGVIAGLVAILGAGGLYLSGAFTKAPEPSAPQETASAESPDPEVQAVEAPEAQVAEPEPTEPVAPAVEEPAAEPAEDAPEVVEDASDTNSAVVTAEDATPTASAPPVLDQIFVETDGTALLSGDAEPGGQIDVLLNGEVVHTFTVDSSGKFAEFVTIPFSDTAQGLVLQSSDGAQTTQSDDYLIAALPKPVEQAPVVEEGPAVDQDTTADAEDQIASATVDAEAEPDTGAEVQTAEPDVVEPETREPETEEPQTADVTTETPEPDQQIAVLRSGEEGVELVQPPVVQDTPPEQIALDTIGYSDTGDVQLTGRVQDGAAVRLYLNNRLVADLAPQQDGSWRSDLEGIDPGIYTLRVDAVNTDGTVLSRVETPFKREPVEVLEAAVAAEQTDAQVDAQAIRSVTVQQGDTLWAISRDRFGDGVLYVRLFEANRDLIRDPDLIYPGQIFTIPE
ncbi:LysM peptidoglycan-binding domain-containing protein [uncultured Ruegeria sp.]|uniref:LysM peptidoglycan-binding domain-containing protein n=1 Tax=uncultured Ruegeria sp. TaxID=259304 RepID=UPI002612357A|nr:LysM peptidoglycan-binding domain-containing protein [uncultured Ruegeria sp.]